MPTMPKPLLLSSLVLILTLGCAAPPSPRVASSLETPQTVACEALGPAFQEIRAAIIRGEDLTPTQKQTLGTWNDDCATTPPPVPPQEPGLTWRDYLDAAVHGFERGATAPVTSCRTTRTQRGSRVGYSTNCMTY